ncbi:MAG: mechanosensitive ion channel family protein [Candidatus Aenigmarchaeota archaeon]|nr:mechanosensitive ion channel family protein [Candidatus Aenigmarchaeota archaeon]
MVFDEIFSGVSGYFPAGTFQFFMAAVIVIGSFILAYVVLFILDKIAHIASTRTKTTLDDKLVAAIRRPVKILFIIGGLHFAMMYINMTGDIFGITVPQIFYILSVFTLAYLIVRILEAVFAWYMEEVAIKTHTKMDESMLPLMNKFIIVIVYVIAIVMILGNLGVEITPLVASLGIGGLAIALALQDTLSNLFSGIYMGIDKPIKKGDFIELENSLKGYVDEIGWRSTRVRQLGNNYVIIPNSKLADSIITNYNDPQPHLSVVVNLGVAYGSDLDKVEKVTIATAKKIQTEVEGAVRDHDPFIRYNEFGDSGINFSVIMRAEAYVSRYLMIHTFMKELMKAYRKNGIEIPFPQRDVWMRSGKK